MIVMHAHIENVEQTYAETYRCVANLKLAHPEYTYVDETTPKFDRWSYWYAINKYWGKDDLMLIDQDVIFDVSQFEQLRNCNHGWCCFYYMRSSQYNEKFVSAWDPAVPSSYTKATVPEFVAYASNGFMLISKRLQTTPLMKFTVRTPIVEAKLGEGADNSIIKNIRITNPQLLIHLHGQIQHKPDPNQKYPPPPVYG